MTQTMRSLERIGAIALNTFREAVRNKVLAVLVLFAIGLIAFSMVLGVLSLHEDVRIIKDLGMAGISGFSVLIALFLGVNLLSKELEKKTVYAIVPKPLHRWEFLLGKYAGLAATMALLVAVMSLILAAIIELKGGDHGEIMLRAELLILAEIWLLTAIALLFSSFSSPYLSAMFAGASWVIGRNSADLFNLVENKIKVAGLRDFLTSALAALPDFRMFYISGANFGDDVVSIHGSFVSWQYVAIAWVYAAAYSAICLLFAMLLFARRDFT